MQQIPRSQLAEWLSRYQAIVVFLAIASIASMFLNKNGVQPMSILAFILGLPLIALRLSQARELFTPIIALTVFLFSVTFTELIHARHQFNITVLDGPSRHLVAAGLFVVIATSNFDHKYLWHAC